MLDPDLRLAIFMEGAVLGPMGKMGIGVLRYSPNPIVCVVDSETAGRNLRELSGVPQRCPILSSISEAASKGAQVLVLGIAPPGGVIPESWWPVIDEAVGLGLSIVNGLHDLVRERYPNLSETPSADRQFVWDIRIEPPGLQNGTGAAAMLPNKRVLMVGTDMSVGKMTAGLEIYRAAGAKGAFVATGQIGITITGAGIPLDAVRVDFASGAVEREVIRHSDAGAQLVVIEGQGSLVHPGSTATLPLLRGACPNFLVMCARAGQSHLRNLPEIPIPPLKDLIPLYEELASTCGTFPRPKTSAVALNTAHLQQEAARVACVEIEQTLQMPCADPVRDGAGRLLSSLLQAG